MKISMYGPRDPNFRFEGDDYSAASVVDVPGRELHANTLGEALAEYTEQFGNSIRLYDGRFPEVPLDPEHPFRLFLFHDPEYGEILTGIGLTRGDEHMWRPLHKDFSLEEGDVVSLGMLGC